MISSGIPKKFPIPFADGAGVGYIRPIPTPSQIGIQNGAASLTDGFPPDCLLPIGAGGVPPFGQDLNGILNQVTAWSRWFSAGGPISYDAAFSTAIGGYPKGSVISAAGLGSFWFCAVDGNTTDPDTGGAGWVGFSPINWYAHDTGAVNAYAATYVPAIAAHMTGVPLRLRIENANTGASTFNPGPGVKGIVRRDGSALIGGELAGIDIVVLTYDGANYRLPGMAPASNAVTAAGTDTQSAVTPAGLASAIASILGPAAGFLRPAHNLSDVASIDVSLANLGFTYAGQWLKFPGGGMIQFGTFTAGATSFPLSFIAAPSIILSNGFSTSALSTTGFSSTGSGYYVAVGHWE